MQADDIVRRIATGILVACLVVVTVTVCAATVPAVKNRLGLTSKTDVGYVVGADIDVAPALYSAVPRTVLFFSRTSCGACQRAKAVESAITADVSAHPGAANVVLVTDTTFQKDESAYAHAIGIPPTRLARVDLSKLRLKRIPTIVVVDNHGKVLEAEEGLFNDAQRQQIVRTALGAPPTQ